MKKVVFVDLVNIAFDQHGVYALSAYMKQHGIEVGFVSSRSQDVVLASLKQMNPDFVLYSCKTDEMTKYVQFDLILKQHLAATSIIGGPGPTYGWKDLTTSSINAICVGEGELALVDFVNVGVAGKNLFLNGTPPSGEYHPFVELDQMPFPDRSVIYDVDPLVRNLPSKQFLSGRGCPYRCTYCLSGKFRHIFQSCGPIVRKKSVDYLLEEILEVRRLYPLNMVVFSDDTFILDKKWLFEFFEHYPTAIGLPYSCNIRADLVDEDVVRGLKNSGCRNVRWSVESGNSILRNEVLLRGMSDEQILNTAELLHKYKLPFSVGNLVGLPGESFDKMLETLELNIRIRPYLGIGNIFVPFPGLDLTRYAIEHGYYDEKPQSGIPRDFFTESILNYPLDEKVRIGRLSCLFPVFVSFPSLYLNNVVRNTLFSLPSWLLRGIHEIIKTYKMSKMFNSHTPFLQKVRLGIRYLQTIFSA